MSEEASGGVTVADVVAAVDEVAPDQVEAGLDPVTDDGIVTRDAVRTAVSDTSKLLATAETRIELAGDAYDGAATAADPLGDVPAVRARLDAFAERLSGVESRVPELRPDLSIPEDVHRRPIAAYDLAVEIRETATAARESVEAADDLSFDIEQFRSWLDRPDRRYDAFAEDVGLVGDAVDDLEATIDGLSHHADPAARWVTTTMRTRVLSLLVADLRAERRDLRVLAERTDEPFREELGDRLDSIADRIDEIESALDDGAAPAWRNRFGRDLAAFERAIATFDPPVEWRAVERTLDAHRPKYPVGDR